MPPVLFSAAAGEDLSDGLDHDFGRPTAFLTPGSAGASPALWRTCGQDARAPGKPTEPRVPFACRSESTASHPGRNDDQGRVQSSVHPLEQDTLVLCAVSTSRANRCTAPACLFSC